MDIGGSYNLAISFSFATKKRIHYHALFNISVRIVIIRFIILNIYNIPVSYLN